MPGGGQVEVVAEVVADRFFRVAQAFAFALHVQAVFQAWQHQWQAFGEVAEDEGQVGVTVEQAAEHQADRVGGGFVGEAPGRADQRWVALVDPSLARQRFAWVQVDRHVECRDSLPEFPDRRFVQVLRGIGVADVGVAVDQCPHHAVILYRALQFVRRGPGRLQGHGGEGLEALRVAGDELLGDLLVGPLREGDGLARIEQPQDAEVWRRSHGFPWPCHFAAIL